MRATYGWGLLTSDIWCKCQYNYFNSHLIVMFKVLNTIYENINKKTSLHYMKIIILTFFHII